MKLKTIFCEYDMPQEFWDKLEKIFEIETKESFEAGFKLATKYSQEKDTSSTNKKGCGKRFQYGKNKYEFLCGEIHNVNGVEEYYLCPECEKSTKKVYGYEQGNLCPECKQFIGTNTMCSDCARFRASTEEARINAHTKVSMDAYDQGFSNGQQDIIDALKLTGIKAPISTDSAPKGCGRKFKMFKDNQSYVHCGYVENILCPDCLKLNKSETTTNTNPTTKTTTNSLRDKTEEIVGNNRETSASLDIHSHGANPSDSSTFSTNVHERNKNLIDGDYK